jgi:predicted Zn-ribbon and HTH transcriptional regulator
MYLPEDAAYYNGELIHQPSQRWTRGQQLELLMAHPLFTGKCPQCQYQFPQNALAASSCSCPACEWIEDGVKVENAIATFRDMS